MTHLCHLMVVGLTIGLCDFSDYAQAVAVDNEPAILACYYMLPGPNDLPTDKIDTSLCTHIITGFSSVKDSTLIPSNPGDVEKYLAVTALKKKEPSLKVMLTVGGNSPMPEIAYAAASAYNRSKFSKSAIALLRKYDFDGLDIDWEFPAWGGAPISQREDFVLLLQEFKSLATEESNQSGNIPLLLSTAVGAPLTIIFVSYNVPEIAKYVDFINLMSYDYHDYRSYTPFTGHNSPLTKLDIEISYFATLNTAWSSNHWARSGMPKTKILVGIPAYGHTFTLATAATGFYALASGPGPGNGTLIYPQVCDFLKKGATRVFSDEAQVPYAYNGTDWVGYDDVESVTRKAKWIRANGFRGAMTWNLNEDDWNATCDGQTTFPLHKKIKENLQLS